MHFVNLRQPVHRVSRLLFSFFPPCSFGSSWTTKLVDQFRESNLMEKKKRERAPLAPMWDTQRELSINLCIKKLIFTLYETSTSNPFPRRNREDSENKNKERKERRKAKKKGKRIKTRQMYNGCCNLYNRHKLRFSYQPWQPLYFVSSPWPRVIGDKIISFPPKDKAIPPR